MTRRHGSPLPSRQRSRRRGGDTKFAMRSVARRYRALYEEIAGLDAQLERLVADAAPGMLALLGVGADHAATLLVAAGDNPERLKSEASLASRTRAGSAIGPKKREGDASRYRTNHPDRQLWR